MPTQATYLNNVLTLKHWAYIHLKISFSIADELVLWIIAYSSTLQMHALIVTLNSALCCVGEKKKKDSLWFLCFLLRNKIPLDPTWWKYPVLMTLVKKKKTKTHQYLCCSTQKVLLSVKLQQWLFYFKQKQFHSYKVKTISIKIPLVY